MSSETQAVKQRSIRRQQDEIAKFSVRAESREGDIFGLDASVVGFDSACMLAAVLRKAGHAVAVFRWYDAAEARLHHYSGPGYKETGI